MYTTKTFIEKAKEIHGDTYDYSLVDYKGSTKKVNLICKVHGLFPIRASAHLEGQGCRLCGREKAGLKSRLDTDSFLKKAKSKFPQYDYSKTKYVNGRTKLIVTCPIHGDFEKFPNHFLNSDGCPYCSRERKTKTTEQFIKDAKKVHGDKYDYSETVYKGACEFVKIICPIHGSFEIPAEKHTNLKRGCPQCGFDNLRDTKEEFIEKANKVHNNLYDYSLVDYKGSVIKVNIICKKHGLFPQKPNDHLNGHGCPYCVHTVSNSEVEIKDYIKSIYSGLVLNNDRTIIEHKELDMYIPEKKVAIEFDGLYWHSDIYKDKNFHLEKTLACEEKGIRLIHIFEDEWLYKKEICKSIIASALGIYQEKIFARKCVIKAVENSIAVQFLKQNHIQGSINGAHLGLFYKNELVQIISYGKNRFKKDEIELYRMCTKLNTQVIGGFSKLIKHLNKDISSYIDRRLFNGNGYLNSGWVFEKYSQPSYFYIKGTERYNRINFQKHKLKDKLKVFDPSLTEGQNMKNNNYYRIYDCGTIKVKYIVKGE